VRLGYQEKSDRFGQRGKEKPAKRIFPLRMIAVQECSDNLHITSGAIEDILPVSSLRFSYYSG
jgi:hypothetical protein